MATILQRDMINKSHYIRGEWIPGAGEAFTSSDPASGQTIWEGRAATAEEIDRAVKAARESFPGWAERPINDRANILHAFGAELKKHHAEFTQIIARETGKP